MQVPCWCWYFKETLVWFSSITLFDMLICCLILYGLVFTRVIFRDSMSYFPFICMSFCWWIRVRKHCKQIFRLVKIVVFHVLYYFCLEIDQEARVGANWFGTNLFHITVYLFWSETSLGIHSGLNLKVTIAA